MNSYYLYNSKWKPLARNLSYIEAERLARSYWNCRTIGGENGVVTKVVDEITGVRLGTIISHREEGDLS